MQKPEGTFDCPRVVIGHTLSAWPFRGPRTSKLEGSMNIARKAAIAIATVGLSLGLLGITAPAQADTSWGYSLQK
jgi:hypothetical protein